MARFIAEFDIDNAAFGDACSEECARILRQLAGEIESDIPVGAMECDGVQIPLLDANGNTVGYARVR
jgi:hypothetical protein